jgi:hypothetical protein
MREAVEERAGEPFRAEDRIAARLSSFRLILRSSRKWAASEASPTLENNLLLNTFRIVSDSLLHQDDKRNSTMIAPVLS